MSTSSDGLNCSPLDLRQGSKMTLLRKCTIALGVLLLLPAFSASADCVAHCLLIQRGMGPTLKALLLLNGLKVLVFCMKILASLRLRWTALILSVKRLGKVF